MSRLGKVPAVVWALVPALLAMLVYLGALPNGFALDDARLVQDNPEIRSISGIPGLLLRPYWPGDAASGLYRPVTVASLAVNRALTGPGPAGFHWGNVLLHAAVCVLVWYAVRRIGVHYGTALVAASLFAVHSLHTEAVANIAGRAELLAAAFVLAAWLAHLRSRDIPRGGAHVSWTLTAALFYLLALLSKENAILAPLLFLLCDRWQHEGGERWTARLPTYGAYAGSLVLGLLLRFHALGGFRGAESAIFLDNPLAWMGAPVRLATALWVQAKYLALFVWPARLCSDYSYNAIPIVDPPADPRFWAGLLTVLGLFGLLIFGWLRSRPLAVGAGIWVLFFLPTANLLFPTGTVMAERLSYLPSLGGCIVLAHLMAALASAASPLPSRLRVVLPVAVGVSLLIALSLRTVERNPVWRDNDSLALHDVRVSPDSAKLHAGAGIVLEARGDREGAEASFRRALEIYPEYAQIHFNLGQLLMARGASDEAIVNFARAAEIAPANPRPYKSIAGLLENAGRREEALRAYAAGTRLDPGDLAFRFNYGRSLLAAGRVPEAQQVLETVSRERPETIVTRLALALLEESRGQPDRAASIYRDLLRHANLSPAIRTNIEGRLATLPQLPPQKKGDRPLLSDPP